MAFLCEQEKYRGTKCSVYFKDQYNEGVYIDFIYVKFIQMFKSYIRI